MPGKPKYKITGKKLYLKDIALSATENQFNCFIKNYFNLTYAHSYKTIALGVEVLVHNALIEYAEDHDCFIEFLIKKGYLEEVQSEYDKWVDEWPSPGVRLENYQELSIEWAKRMPRKQ